MSVERRRQMIEPQHPRLSVTRQCELVWISRPGFNYRPAGETALNLALMRLISCVGQSLQNGGGGCAVMFPCSAEWRFLIPACDRERAARSRSQGSPQATGGAKRP